MPLLFLSRDLGNPDFLEANLRLGLVSKEAPSLAVLDTRAWPPELCGVLLILLLLVVHPGGYPN
jgi:hypothetical protein